MTDSLWQTRLKSAVELMQLLDWLRKVLPSPSAHGQPSTHDCRLNHVACRIIAMLDGSPGDPCQDLWECLNVEIFNTGILSSLAINLTFQHLAVSSTWSVLLLGPSSHGLTTES